MPDNVNITPGNGAVISTDEVTRNAIVQQVQYVKLMNGLDGSAEPIEGSAAFGLDVDVMRLPANTQANALYTRSRQVASYRAVYRLATRPYALQRTFTANSRFQYATLWHPATATKTVRLRRVQIAIQQSTVAGIINVDLVRLGNTAPAGGTAITSVPLDSSEAGAEASAFALPATQGTEATGGLIIGTVYNLGITGAAPTTNPPSPLNFVDLYSESAGGGAEEKTPVLRPGVAEGFAVVLDVNSASVVHAFVQMAFTEE